MRRLRACVERWPQCWPLKYDPRCCRFPKSCSCDVYDEDTISEADLECDQSHIVTLRNRQPGVESQSAAGQVSDDPQVGGPVILRGRIKAIIEGVALVEVYRTYPVGGTVAVQCGALELDESEYDDGSPVRELTP